MPIDPVALADEIARRDADFGPVVAATGPPPIGRRRHVSHFASLTHAICHQQLAGAAARTIHRRVVAAVGAPPTAEGVLVAGEASLRAAGMSAAKTASLLDLAGRVDDGRLRLARIGRLDDEAVVAELTTVRGIGRWTAEMFLLFQLGRPDVWPTGDLGVRNGWARVHRLAATPSERELATVADHLVGMRSAVAWYCWRALELPGA